MFRIPGRASERAIDRARAHLEHALGPSKVLVDAAACEPYGRDDSPFLPGGAPDAVVLASSIDDVRRALEIAEKDEVPIVPRAAGTGRTGGAVPACGGIVLATHPMKRVLEIHREDMVAVVEPGVVTGELQALVEAEGLFFPPDPGSLDTCQIGGNVAENAGGPRAFKYGVTRDYVLGLETALVGGRVLQVGRRTSKGVTGYDVTALLVGSEGTLGVFSKIVLKLVPKPPELRTILALFSDVRAAAASVTRLVEAAQVPRCLELLDAETLAAVRAAGVAVDPRAGAMLLIELDGDAACVQSASERVGEAAASAPGVLDVVAAQDEAQRARLWAARRQLSTATRKLTKYKLSEDVVVPRSRLADLFTCVDEIGERQHVRHLAYGHAGDGNLHVNFLWDAAEEEPRVHRAIEELMHATVALGGTLSGEHGIGLAKAAYLGIEQSGDLIELQRALKRVFDPKGLLNPGKIFPEAGRQDG